MRNKDSFNLSAAATLLETLKGELEYKDFTVTETFNEEGKLYCIEAKWQHHQIIVIATLPNTGFVKVIYNNSVDKVKEWWYPVDYYNLILSRLSYIISEVK